MMYCMASDRNLYRLDWQAWNGWGGAHLDEVNKVAAAISPGASITHNAQDAHHRTCLLRIASRGLALWHNAEQGLLAAWFAESCLALCFCPKHWPCMQQFN